AAKDELKNLHEQQKQARRNLEEARKAQDVGYAASVKAQRAAAKEAGLWDTPLRNMATEARERLKTANSADPSTLDDLAAVGAEKFLREARGGVPAKRAIRPRQFYDEMETEFPNLVTPKNRGQVYKASYQRIEDAVAAAREAARLRSASAESQKVWEEQGMDIDAQSLLIQKAE